MQQRYLRRLTPAKPACRISRATRLRLTRIPKSARSRTGRRRAICSGLQAFAHRLSFRGPCRRPLWVAMLTRLIAPSQLDCREQFRCGNGQYSGSNSGEAMRNGAAISMRAGDFDGWHFQCRHFKTTVLYRICGQPAGPSWVCASARPRRSMRSCSMIPSRACRSWLPLRRRMQQRYYGEDVEFNQRRGPSNMSLAAILARQHRRRADRAKRWRCADRAARNEQQRAVFGRGAGVPCRRW
jgi:hypothetical protein